MFKKMTVLAMAVGVLAAMVLPASASALWVQNHEPLSADKTLGLTGNVRFQGGLGGIQCQITSTVDFLKGQTNGTATTFDAHPGDETQNCQGTGGLIGCQIHNLTPQQGLTWAVTTEAFKTVTKIEGTFPNQKTVLGAEHTKAAVVHIGAITSTATGGFCPVNHIELTAGTIGIAEEGAGADGTTITNVEVNGALDAHLRTVSGVVHHEEVLATGTLTVESPDAGIYGF